MRNPLDPLNRLIYRSADRQLRWERESIGGNDHPWFALVMAVLVMAAIVLDGFFDGHVTWVGGAAAIFLGACAGTGVTAGLRARSAYRRGWFAGREAMFDSMGEAAARGLTPHQWANNEMERDIANVVGYRHTAPEPRPRDGSHEDIP